MGKHSFLHLATFLLGFFLSLPHHHHSSWSDVNCRLTEGGLFWHFPQMRFSSVRLLSLRHFHPAKVNKQGTLWRSALLKWRRKKPRTCIPCRRTPTCCMLLIRHYGGVQYPDTRSAVNITSCLSHYLAKWKPPPGSRSHLCQCNLTFFSFFPVKRDFNYESRSQPQKIPKAQFPFSHTDQWN